MDEAEAPLTIRQNMIWNSLGSMVNLGCQWLLSVLMVRFAGGYEAAGAYSLAMAVYGIFAPIAQYRMYTYQVSDVTNENTTGEYLAFRFVTDALAFLSVAVYTLATCDQSSWGIILLFSIYKIVATIIDVLHACDQRNHRMDYIGKSLALQGVISLAVFCVLFIGTQSLEFTFFGMTVGILAIAVVYDLPRSRQFGTIVPRISIRKTLRLLVRCLPIVLAGIAVSATPSIPRQYLSNAFGESALGVYSSVAAPVAIIQMGASYIYNPLMGYFSERYAECDKKGFMRLFASSSCAIALIGLACAIGLAIFGEPLLVLVFGESIRSYAYLLLPLVAFAFLTGFSWFLNDLLIALRSFRAATTAGIVGFVAMLASVVPVVDAYQLAGVTYVGFISVGASTLYMLFAVMLLLRSKWGPVS